MMSQLPQPPRFSTPDASVSHKIALDRPFSATVPTPVGAVSENTLQQRQLRSPENAAASMSDPERLLETVLYQQETDLRGIKKHCH